MNDADPRTVRLAAPRAEEQFELVSEAGSGGMGTVWKARDPQTGGAVAVKLLKRESDAVRFALEVHALARLHHPNIVAYVGHGVTPDGAQFLAMEWLDGESLSSLLRRDAPPLRRVLEIARDVSAALSYAHDAGVVHRDLKPSNIFLSTDGVKVLDFGVARVRGAAGLTRTGEVIGTPSYMAPEQARGDKSLGPRADLFSLGCVLYKCFTGASPFAASDVMSALSKLATDVPARLRDVPRAVADLVARLLEKDPSARPESAREVRDAIDAMLATSLDVEKTPVIAEPTLRSPTTRPPPTPRGSRTIAIGVLGAAFVVGGVAVYALRSKTFEPPSASQAPPTNASRAIAERACRTWAPELTRRQKPDGAFAGETHRAATGWDTAQELAALERATACATVAPVALRSATDALVRLRAPDGWSGPERFGPAVVSVPAIAWATIALALRAAKDPTAAPLARDARALLVPLEHADGGFAFGTKTDPADAYATLVGAWALLVSTALDPDDAALSSRRTLALDWLRAALRSPASPIRDVAGLEEQTIWLLVEARRDAKDETGDDVLRAGAADVVARCSLDAHTRACTRPVYADGETPVGTGTLVTLWHPWAAAASHALLASGVSLSPDLRADLAAVERWAASTIEASIDALATLPEYRLAEYAIAMSSLAAR